MTDVSRRRRLPLRLALLALALAGAPTMAVASGNPADFAYDQKPGAALPAVPLREADGQATSLPALLNGRPGILALGYFRCPNLCGLVRADLLHALAESGMIAGEEYELLALSIDPAETPADAEAARRADRAQFPLPGDARAMHYLTGAAADLRAVAAAAGFRDRFDVDSKQFLHPAGLVFVTASGVVSGYLLGVGYAGRDVRLGVTRAATGTVAAAALPVLLLCFHYDPASGRYSLAVLKLLRLGAAITVLVLGGTMLLAFRRQRSAAR